MAHESQRAFVESVKKMFPGWFESRGLRVLEIGSLNINGAVVDLFTGDDLEYVGVDLIKGPGVTLVSPVHEIVHNKFDVIISCESMEHDPHLDKTCSAINRLLKMGGLLIITAAGPNRIAHYDGGSDHYQAITMDFLHNAFDQFTDLHVKYERGHQDIYLWGIK